MKIKLLFENEYANKTSPFSFGGVFVFFSWALCVL
jgi:hypothetical protein